MNSDTANQNSTNSGRKTIIVAVCIVAAVVVSAVSFFVFKNSIFTAVAVKRIEKEQFASARTVALKITDDSGDVITDYIDLRVEINRKYPTLLADFDIDTMTAWRDKANEIESSGKLPNALSGAIEKLGNKLETVCNLESDYRGMRENVLSMMDVFGEINRLYTQDENGKNPVFTISEERNKIAQWQAICQTLSSFSAELPDGDSVYLLSYLISETYSECDEINNQLSQIQAMGYGENDTVRENGTAQKTFPDITNTAGTTVSVTDKTEYEEYLYIAVCRALTQSLAEYYSGI